MTRFGRLQAAFVLTAVAVAIFCVCVGSGCVAHFHFAGTYYKDIGNPDNAVIESTISPWDFMRPPNESSRGTPDKEE